MAELPKRPNYFQSQFLVVRDFQDEQAYHEGMLRRHNRYLHEWGVVGDGMQVSKTGDNRSLLVSPGSAIDGLGREIVLESPGGSLKIEDVRSLAAQDGTAQDVYITIAFQESDSNSPDDKYPPPNGTVNVTRKMQMPLISAAKTLPTDGATVILARVRVPADAGGDVGKPDNSVRKLASSLIARGSNLRDISLDGALSFTSKENPNPQAGLDYDSVTDTMRIRARTKDSPALDATHVAIQRDTGNVGIGTLPTAARLSISAAPNVGTLIDFAVAQYQLTLRYKSLERDTVSYFFDLVNNNARADNFLAFHKGNIGVGTTSPVAKLHVGSGAIQVGTVGDFITTIDSSITHKYASEENPRYTITRDLVGSGNAGIGFGWPSVSIKVGGSAVGIPATRSLAFYTSDGTVLAERVRIDRSGNVGIGTPSPDRLLTLQGTGGAYLNVKEINSAVEVLLGSDAAGGIVSTMSNHDLQFRAGGNSTKMVIKASGNVGIGTATPAAPLHIGVAQRVPHKIDDQYALLGYQWNSNRGNDFRSGLSDRGQPQYFDNTSICAEGRIVSLEFNAFSDSRIKKSLRTSDSSDALRMLKQLSVTDYQFKDSLAHGDQYHKGFIAEEVERLFPQAVRKRSDFIPDIYALAEKTTLKDDVLTISMRDAHGLTSGDMVRLITEANGVKEVSVTVVDEKTFAVNNWTGADGKLFAYGKRVDDFRTLDYQQIFSLGISALQQLSIEVDELKAANGALKERLRLLESRTEIGPNLAAAKKGSNGNGSH